jgi:hypothetical protein
MSYMNNPWDPNYNRADRDDFFASREWRGIRWVVLKRDGHRCRGCGSTDGKLHVDHIEPVSVNWSRRLDPTNLQVLCEDCNMGKGRDIYKCPAPIQSLPNSVTITSSMVDDLRTNGAFTRATIVGLGLDYGNLKKGWPRDLIGKTVPRAIWDAARAGVGIYSGKRGQQQRKQLQQRNK